MTDRLKPHQIARGRSGHETLMDLTDLGYVIVHPDDHPNPHVGSDDDKTWAADDLWNDIFAAAETGDTMSKHLLHLDAMGEQGLAEMHLTCEHGPDDDEFHPEYDVSPVGVIGTVRERLDVCWLRMQWDHQYTDLISSLPGPLTWPLPVTGEWDGDDCYLIRAIFAAAEEPTTMRRMRRPSVTQGQALQDHHSTAEEPTP